MKIRRGDRGEKVKTLQRTLNLHGFDLVEDGIFGKGTDEAVRAFQRRQGLQVDGIAGKSTLNALGLDAETLEPLEGGSHVDVIDFTEEDVTVPPPVQQRIRQYAEEALEMHSKLLTSTLNALAQFETTMAHASAAEANPDVLGVLVSQAIDESVNAAVKKVPGLADVKSVYDTVTNELERAGKAQQSLAMGDWIKDQRAVIDGSMQNVDLDEMTFQLEERYLDRNREGRQRFFDELFEGIQRLQALSLPNIDELECSFYEQWINAHFTHIADDAPGCIEYRYEYEDGTFDFVSCEVKAPSGRKIETALNRLLDRGQIPRIQKPIDLRVRKRASFRVDNFMPGGKSWSSGWLDADNRSIHTPILDAAVEAFNDRGWRTFARRFKHA
ncbi:MAG: peptidoglycan-binding domain-containing protein [Anaerolineales bacterium]